MAINSSGYETTLYTEEEWALWHGSVRPYGIKRYGDLKVSSLTGTGLTCQVAAGTAYGHGVRDVVTVPTNVTFAAAPSSGTRYDLVSLRRDWSGTGGTSSLVVTSGSTARSVPSRNRTPGTLDDQPLALVPISAASASPGTPIDLRTWGTGTIHVEDILAITPDDWPMGTRVLVGWGKNAIPYEVQGSGATTSVLARLPRTPVTSPDYISIDFSNVTAVVVHGLGWTPTRMEFDYLVPGGYVNVGRIFTVSVNSNTAVVTCAVTSGSTNNTGAYRGTIAGCTWTAYEGI